MRNLQLCFLPLMLVLLSMTLLPVDVAAGVPSKRQVLAGLQPIVATASPTPTLGAFHLAPRATLNPDSRSLMTGTASRGRYLATGTGTGRFHHHNHTMLRDALYPSGTSQPYLRERPAKSPYGTDAAYSIHSTLNHTRSHVAKRASNTTSELMSKTSKSPAKSSGPVWNPTNANCDELVDLTPAQQWKAVDGDFVAQTMDKMFQSNQLVCPDCFGMDKEECTSTSPECKNGLRDLARPNGKGKPRWDAAAAIFARDTELTDLMCIIQTGECGAAPSCKDCDGPGAYAILKSLETMHNVLQNAYDAIGAAGSYASMQMEAFKDAFAPVPSFLTQAIILEVILGIVGGLLGAIGGAWGVFFGILFAVGAGVGMSMLFFNMPSPPDTSTYLGLITNQTQIEYAQIANDLFATGTYQWTSSDGKKSTDINMVTLMKDGALLAESGDLSKDYTNIIPVFELILFQQLAFFTWTNLEKDNVVHTPYIVFDPMECDKVDSNDKNTLQGSGTLSVNNLDANITYNGSCYYLLDAHPDTFLDLPYGDCNGAHALPGGTNKDLKDAAAIFAELSLADFIIPSVGGWKANYEQNGYPMASSDGQLVDDPRAPGTVNIPVCDYMKHADNPGVGCPILNGDLNGKGCNVYAPSTGKNQPGDFQPGTCGVYVIQYQRNEGDEINPLKNYQLEITIYDSDQREIGAAMKQSAQDVLKVMDTVLPYSLAVAAPGPSDSDPVEFWYADQYWNSSSNACTGGDSFHGGSAQINCTFSCPYPNSANGPVTATSAHPFPDPVTVADPGPTHFPNTWGLSAPTNTNTAPIPTQTFAHGSCDLHIVQYQRDETGTGLNPSNNYELEVTLYDDKQHFEGYSGRVPAPTDKQVNVTGLGADPVIITAFASDDDSLRVEYKSQHFFTNDSQCGQQGFHSGLRNIDCTFNC